MSAQDETNVVVIPRDFNAKEGTKLTEGLFIGKHISSGLQVKLSCARLLTVCLLALHMAGFKGVPALQGGVYDLVDKDGLPVDVVVKVSVLHALLAGPF